MNNKVIKEIIMKDSKIPLYIKILIILYDYQYFGRKYIPNKLLCKRLNCNVRTLQRNMKILIDKKYIHTYTYKNKKYFYILEDKKYEETTIKFFDYNWLEEEN